MHGPEPVVVCVYAPATTKGHADSPGLECCLGPCKYLMSEQDWPLQLCLGSTVELALLVGQA